MRVDEPPAARGLRAEGEIVNASGVVVARRSLAGKAGDCEGLARAVGLWASLVLDQEVGRPAKANRAGDKPGGDAPSDSGRNDPPAPAADRPESSASPPASSGLSANTPRDDGLTDDGATDSNGSRTASRFDDGLAGPENDAPRRRDAHRTFEIGLGTFLMTGTGANAILGGTPYAVLEATPGFFLRPAVAVGESLTPLGGPGNLTATFVAARLDACTRVPGNYTQNRGLELTFCGGADVGATYFPAPPAGYAGVGAPHANTTLPQASLGPSLDLRGELASRWSLILRGVCGANVVRNGFTDRQGNRVSPDWVSGRLELALAWSVR
jgi:hypothetical protein